MKKKVAILFLSVVITVPAICQSNFTLNPGEVADVTPNVSSGWTESASSIVRLMTITAKGGSANTLAIAVDASSGTASTLYARHISSPLAKQTISGTVKGQLRMLISGTSGSTANSYIIITVINPAGAIVATLLAGQLGDLALTTTTTNRKTPPSGTALSSYSCNTGDRICVETGIKRTAGTTARTGTVVYTGTGTNLPEDNTTTSSGKSWIEFSQTLVFNQGIIFFSNNKKAKPHETNDHSFNYCFIILLFTGASKARFNDFKIQSRHSKNLRSGFKRA